MSRPGTIRARKHSLKEITHADLRALLYLCGLRISEVVDTIMGAFFCRRNKDGKQRW